MAIPQSATILHHLRQSILRREGAGLSDGQLLRSFLYRHDEAAFEALVRRHGPMVRGVCRRILRNYHDADDAFQAAFLVLLRKASTLEAREVIGDWLHGVAYRTALKARTAAARRRWKEQQAIRCETIIDEPGHSEWLPLLDQEISRLPAKYRQPVVLCDLEGRTRKDAAEHLGWPEGTLSGRLSRARAMLARRLTRCGVTLSAASLAIGLAGEASAHLPFSLVGSTCKAAMACAAQSAAGAVPGHVAALTEGVVNAMFIAKLKKIAAVMTAVLILAVGAGVWRYAAEAGQGEKKSKAAKQGLPKVIGTKDGEKIPPLPRAAPIPLGKGSFQIDLRLALVKDGQRKVLAYPRLINPDGIGGHFGVGTSCVYRINGGQVELFHHGQSIEVKVCSSDRGKLCLVMTVSHPTFAAFEQEATFESRSLRVLRWIELGKPITVKLRTSDKDQNFLEVTAAVQEADKAAEIDLDADSRQKGFYPTYSAAWPPMPTEQEKKDLQAKRDAAAKKDFTIAEYFRWSGHPDSARFYYEMIRQRYPNTDYAKRAQQRLAEVKVPARAGQIFVSGNETIPTEAIVNELTIFPGQILNLLDLQIVEQKLSRLKGVKKCEVRVIDREGEDTFKDIHIKVEEK